MMKSPEPNALRIESIIAGGDGLARGPDGRAVFIARAAPGELVEVEYTEEQKQWLRGRLLRVIESSPDRRDPVCPHYERCGGCQLQHLEYNAQVSAKVSIVVESMRRLGGIEMVRPEAVPSVRELGYRNRISLVLRRGEDGFVAGYHAYDDAAEIVRIDSCPLAEPAINEAWASLKSLWEREPDRMPAGDELRLTLRTGSGGDVGLIVERLRGRSGNGLRTATAGSATPGARDREGRPRIGLMKSVPCLSAVWLMDERGKVTGHEGAESLREQAGSFELPLAGKSFLQVNRETASKLEEYVRDQCGPISGQRVVDAYCGYGLRAIELALAGARVTGIDMDAMAIVAGVRLASAASAPVRFMAADVESTLRRHLPAEVIVLNPPRRGLARPVTETLFKKPPERLIYVSCNPATLARDLKRLSGQFEIVECKAFDLFPQTAHIETVVTLRRRDVELQNT